ncbi:MAG: transposase [Candidatus Brocadiia bacterium]
MAKIEDVMPRANRYIMPGHAYHLTHRCHDREFLLRFQKDRDTYREWLREGMSRHGVSVLGYCITSNHVHLVVSGEQQQKVSSMMQLAAGCTASEYNVRKGRKGAFWEGRYGCTMIESGEHLWRCLLYVDMNMVRAGVAGHPREWEWCGYREVVGLRERYRVLDRQKLMDDLRVAGADELRERYRALIDSRVSGHRLARQPQWTESVAVGSESFVEEVAEKLGRRARIKLEPTGDPGEDSWRVREASPSYSHF